MSNLLLDEETLRRCFEVFAIDCPNDHLIPNECRKHNYVDVTDVNGLKLTCPTCDDSTCGNIFITLYKE